MKRRYGQHFLTDPGILRRIVEFAEIPPQAAVVEIGPGGGALTRILAERASRVTAIEIDSDLIPELRATLPPHVTIIQGDATTYDWSGTPEPVHVLGNLPYNVATAIIKNVVGSRRWIARATFMVQKEVGERLMARPRTDAYGSLSVFVQHYAVVTRGFVIGPGAFKPRPKVDSMVLRLDWKPGVRDDTALTDFVQAVFQERRKTLLNNLLRMASGAGRSTIEQALGQCGIPPTARAEEMTLEDFKRMHETLAAIIRPGI